MSLRPASLLAAIAALLAWAPGAVAVPPNDEYENAQRLNEPGSPLTSVSAPGSNVDASTGDMPNGFGGTTNEPSQCFSPGFSLGYGSTVWFEVSADVPGHLSVRIDPTATFDPAVRIVPLAANGLPAASRSTCAVGAGEGEDEVVSAVGTPGTFRVQVGGERSITVCSLPPSPPCFEFVSDEGAFTISATLERDSDADGVPDAEDGCPAIAGGLGGCPDSDGDGIVDPRDRCPQEDSGARDRDRDGCLDTLRLEADALLRFINTRTGILVRSLRLRNVPRGARVSVSCSRKACKRIAFKAVRGRSARNVAIRALSGKRLRAGTRVTIRVTRKGAIGSYIQYRIRRGALRKIERCLPVGSVKPRRRC